MTSVEPSTRRRWLAAIAGGFMLAAAFPNWSVAGLAWVAPGVILMSAAGAPGRLAFRLGYAAGLAHYLTSLYWLLLIPFPIGAFLGWLALSFYLSLYPAAWVWLCWKLFPETERLPGTDAPGAVGGVFGALAATPLVIRSGWALGCAVLWVALEMVVGRLFSGFPWNFVGSSQYEMISLIQVAAFTGIYGVSFLAVWFSIALACGAVGLMARPGTARVWLGDLMLPFLVVAAVLVYGLRTIREAPAPRATIDVALIQPSIPQTLIWDPSESSNRFSQLIELSERALESKPDLLLWPEAAVPNLLRYEPETYEAITELLKKHGAWMILGADDAVPRAEAPGGRKFDFYNSSFLISPDGDLRAAYRKRRLVIFGEYIPFVRWLPFLKKVIPAGEGFAAGDKAVPFEIPELEVSTSVLICFEDTFPQLAREAAKPSTDFLINLTNNGWFGESAAQWQHAAGAVFRAVENGLPLVRCANNGLTCWVDSLGRMHEVYFPGSEDIYQVGFKLAEIPILPQNGERKPTFYTRHGDWFGWGCVAASSGWVGVGLWRRRGPKRGKETGAATE